MKFKISKPLLFTLGALAAFGPMSIDLYLPAFTSMANDFGVDTSAIQYSLTSFFAGLSLGQLIYGPISDKYGRKKPLIFGILLFIVASLAIVFTKDLNSLVALRFIQALGSCVGMVITRALVRDMFKPIDVAKVFSLIILIMGGAPIVAPIIGTQILHFYHWRGLFVFLAIFGVLALLGVSTYIKETLKEKIPLKRSFFNYYKLFGDRQFLIASLISGTASASMFSYISSASFVFLDLYKVGVNTFPFIFGLNALGFISVSQINIRLLDKYNIDDILKFGITLLFGSAIVLAILSHYKASVLWFEFSLFFMIGSIGLVLPNISSKALEFQSERAGVASALMGSLQFLISSLGTIIVTSLSDGTSWPMICGVLLFTGSTFLLYFLGMAHTKSSYCNQI